MQMELWKYRPKTPELSAITQLLNEAFSGLAAQGMNYVASHQDEAQTLHRLTSGEPWIARDLEGAIAGTITLRNEANDYPECQYYQKPGVYFFEQFAVRTDQQQNGIGRRLLETAERRAKQLGATELACDTSESAADLIAMYKRYGYQIVDHVDWAVTNYVSVVLSKPLNTTQ